jgi:hypothetical protein
LAKLPDAPGLDIAVCFKHKKEYALEYGLTEAELAADSHRIMDTLAVS